MNNPSENILFSLKDSYLLRGIAIIMVLLSHYGAWAGQWLELPFITAILSRLGCYGVDIFFLLSGYSLFKTTQTKKMDLTFLWKRLKNMYIPYLLIAGIIELSAGGITSLKELRKYLLGEDYWFIFNILVFYIAFFVIWRIGKLRLLLLGLFTLFFSCLLYQTGRQDFWYISNAAFFLGVLAGQYEQRLYKTIYSFYFRTLAVLIAGMGFFIFAGLQILANLWWSILILYIPKLILFHSKTLLFLGKHSLYLYMLHTFLYFQVLNLFSFKLPRLFPRGIQPWVLITAILVTILTGWLLKLICDKTFQILEKIFQQKKNKIGD